MTETSSIDMATAPREVLTYERFGIAVRQLATTVLESGFQPDWIVAIARGGLIIGGALAYALGHKNIATVNVEFYTGIDDRLDVPVELPPGRIMGELGFIDPKNRRTQTVESLEDSEVLTITYDKLRGEPRTTARARHADASGRTGDCVNCGICEQVCPAGIDIRHGAQYECINCGLCADGCDRVMLKLGRAPGLIRMASEHELASAAHVGATPRGLGAAMATYTMAWDVGLVLGGVIFGFVVDATSPATAFATRLRARPWNLASSGSSDAQSVSLPGNTATPEPLRFSTFWPARWRVCAALMASSASFLPYSTCSLSHNSSAGRT